MQRLSVVLATLLLPVASGAIAQAPRPARLESISLPGTRVAHRLATPEPPTPGAGSASAFPPARDDNGVDLGVTMREESFGVLEQSVAVLPGGGFAAIWHEGPTKNAIDRLQFVRPNGETVFPDGGLALTSSDGDFHLAVVAHQTSGVYVAYQRAFDAGSNEIRLQWIDGNGQRRWGIDGVLVFGTPMDNQVYLTPSIVAGPVGGAFVCAHRTRFQFDTPIVCQFVDATGAPRWGAAGVLAGGVRGWRVLPKAVSDGSGGVMVFWLNKRMLDDATIDPILVEGQHFSATGTRLWGTDGLAVRTTNLAEYPVHTYTELDVVADGAGGAVVAFEDWNGDPPATRDVYAQRAAYDGTLPWGEGIAVAAGAEFQQLDSLTAVRDGGAIVAAVEFQGKYNSSVRVFRLGADGAPRWGALGVPLSDPSATSMTYGSSGEIHGNRLRMAWTNQKQPATWTFDIYTADFLLDGVRLSPALGLPLFDGDDADFSRGFAYDAARDQTFAVFDVNGPRVSEGNTMGALFPADRLFRDGFQ